MIYLACPYSHPVAAVRQFRFNAANRVAGVLMKRGLHVFSPISHTHPIAEACGLPLGWDYWQGYDAAMLACCRSIYVLQLDGWAQSAGVCGEMQIAEGLGLQLQFLHPHNFGLPLTLTEAAA